MWTRPWPATAASRGPRPAPRRAGRMSAVATARGPLCVRAGCPGAGGGRYLSGRQTAVDTSMATIQPGHLCWIPTVRTVVVREAADGHSADGSGLLQLPLLLLKAGPAGGLAAA